MKTNEIPPRTLIDLCTNVSKELRYWRECMIGDDDEGTNTDNIKNVDNLLEELQFCIGVCKKRDMEFRDKNTS